MKTKLKSSLLAGVAALLTLLPCASSTLPDIAKPYLGAYECERITLGSKDLTDEAFITLELLPEGKFVAYYCEKKGKKKKIEGTYRYDAEKETLTLTDGEIKREAPLEQGAFTLNLPVGRKRLLLKFRQK